MENNTQFVVHKAIFIIKFQCVLYVTAFFSSHHQALHLDVVTAGSRTETCITNWQL